MTATTAPPRSGLPLARLLLVAAAVLGALFAAAAPASAHAALLGSNPKAGAVVAKAPADVALTFSEQVAMDNKSIRVLDPKGKRSDTAKLRNLSKGSTVTYGVDLRPGLAKGTYTVAWQAISADSHPVSGAFTFSIGAPSRTTVSATGENVGGGLVGVLYGAARYASYAGFIVLAGGGAFIVACWQRGANERPLQRLVVRGWLTLTAATLVLLLLRAPYTGSGHLGDVFDLSALKGVLQTKPGAALVSRLLLLGASALFVAVLFGAYARRTVSTDPEAAKERKDLTFGLGVGGTVVAAGIAATWALTEHASVGLQPGIAMPVDIVHLLAVAVWLGGLAALLVALFRTPSIERAAVRRFSGIAFTAVCTLAATGLYQSWRQVGSWSALFGTAYGQLLMVKVGLVAVVVCIASFSRRWTARLSETAADGAAAGETPAVAAEAVATEGSLTGTAEQEQEPLTVPADPRRAAQLARQQAARTVVREKRVRDADPHRTGLRKSVLAETVVAVALLAVTTVLTTTEPGRTEEEAGRGSSSSAAAAVPSGPVDLTLPFDTGGPKGKGTAALEITPGRSGSNQLHLFVNNPAGKPYDVPEVRIALTLKAKKIGPLPVVPDHLFTGHWSADGVQIPMAGKWDIAVTVRTSDIDETTVNKTVEIG
ncbi:copper resistance protein CopC/CopD [Streptomyces sp. SID10853]|uniref:copper resistance CopC/CopD family protein n=1 Tax=Streptomyces sp. SID10853 TaxID=2706028 RepID=UPI0013C00325|nr:copper resistance protein CopC [Streptomyces sp. SID10853]NDZ79852.1 copper resistance protein CopC/CopD [Streptomyces sp. SID10853]